MLSMKIWVPVLSVYTCLCYVLAEHPCGENPVRRFSSLTRILGDMFPGRDINPAMALLRESNPELHRRLQPVVSMLESEWRLYTDCVTMVDNGYFKRSDPMMIKTTQENVWESRKKKQYKLPLRGDLFSSRLLDTIKEARF